MDGFGTDDLLLFDDFRFDCCERCLFRVDQTGAAEPVSLAPRAADLLYLLLKQHGELVTKDMIMKAVWSGRVVEEANLNVQISHLRKALDQGRARSCIQTVTGHGYRFVAPVVHPRACTADSSVIGSMAMALRSRLLAIIVLPFLSLGEDHEQQCLADGITEELTTELSSAWPISVVSRNTALAYHHKAVETRRIGDDLQVHYVLEGSVRCRGNRVRVHARLIDAEADTYLWTERFDCEARDFFELPSEIADRIAKALAVDKLLTTPAIWAESAKTSGHNRGRALSAPQGDPRGNGYGFALDFPVLQASDAGSAGKANFQEDTQ
jgi:TolB-like protein/DNA-binding winged helix-turn-helix (wHTH) protein